MMRYKSCARCDGDLRLEFDDQLRIDLYRCIECGRRYMSWDLRFHEKTRLVDNRLRPGRVPNA